MSRKFNYEKLIEEGKNQPTAIWKLFNELDAGKRKCEKENKASSIKIGYNEINGPDEIANAFNNYFVNIAEHMKDFMPPSNHEKLREYCNSKLPTVASFEIPLLSNDKVLKYLQGVDIRKSTWTDDISRRLPKIAARNIADCLSYICNLSIKTGTP